MSNTTIATNRLSVYFYNIEDAEKELQHKVLPVSLTNEDWEELTTVKTPLEWSKERAASMLKGVEIRFAELLPLMEEEEEEGLPDEFYQNLDEEYED